MIRFDSDQFYPGKIMFSQYPGFGIRAQDIPSDGEDGPSIFYNDAIELNAAPTDEFMAELLTVPSAGVFNLYEDGSFDFTGAPPGVYYATYRGYINGVEYGVFTITLNIGIVAQDVTVIPMQQLTESVSFSVSQNQVLSVPAFQQLAQSAPIIISQNVDQGTVQQVVIPAVEQLNQVAPLSVNQAQTILVAPLAQLTQSVLAAISVSQNVNVLPVQQLTQSVFIREQVPESINPFYIKLTVLPSPFTLSR